MPGSLDSTPETRCRLSYLADAVDGTQQELVQVSVVQQGSVLKNDCLHHVVHLQAQPAAGETHTAGKPWKALLLPPEGSPPWAAVAMQEQG